MFLASADTQLFGELATYLFFDLHEQYDYVFIRRSKCFSTRTDLPKFLIMVYGKIGKPAKAIVVEKYQQQQLEKNETDNEDILNATKNQIYIEITRNLHKITEKMVLLLNETHCHYFYLNPKEFNKCTKANFDLKESLPHFGFFKENKRKFLYLNKSGSGPHPMAFTFISAFISLKCETSTCSNLNLNKVMIRHSNLKDFIKLEDNNSLPYYYKTRKAKHYTALKLWELSRTSKELGVFLVRDADLEQFRRSIPNKSLVEDNMDKDSKSLRFLVNDKIAFEEVTKRVDNVHEVAFDSTYSLLYWLRSSHSTHMLQEFVLNAEIDETSIDPMDYPVKIMSGFGKTLFFKQLQNDLRKEDNARWIELVDGDMLMKKIFQKIKTPLDVLYFLFRVTNEWEKCVLNYCLKFPGRLILILDNLDDIGKELTYAISCIILNIHKEFPNVHMWIAARDPLQVFLTKYIPILPYYLQEFGKEDGKNLIKNILSEYKHINLEATISKIYGENQNSFVVNPQFLVMACDIFKEEGDDTPTYCIDVLDFYIHKKTKGKDIEELSQSACYIIFNSELDLQVDIQEDFSFYNVFGQFKDRIVAEYLSALYLIKNFNVIAAKGLYFKKTLSRVMDLFDRILFRDSKIGTAVLNGDFEKVIVLSATIDVTATKDIFGRSLLHIVRNDFAGILDYLLEKGLNLSCTDNLLNETPEAYMDGKEAYNCIEILLKHNCDSEKFKKLLSCPKTDLNMFFEDQLNVRHFSICNLLVEKRTDFVVTASTIYHVTSFLEEYPKELVIKILNIAKEQGLHEPSYVDNWGETAVHNVARDPNGLEIMKILVEDFNYNVKAEDYSGAKPILLVSNVDLLDYLIKKGANPYHKHTKCNFRSLFETACVNGNLEIVKYYIDVLKADFKDLQSNGEISSLYYAVSSGNLDLVDYLFNNGFNNVNEVNKITGETPLHAACQGGDIKIVKYLVEHGSDVNIATYDDNLRPIDVISSLSPNISEIYNFLIEKGSIFGADHLFNLLKTKSYKCFKNAAFKLTMDWDYRNSDGDTLLHYSAKYVKNRDILEYIGNHSNLELCNEQEGATALHLAFSVGNDDAIEVLLRLGANVQAKSKCKRNMLHFAVMTSKRNSLEMLLRLGIDINERDDQGKSPVHYFASAGDSELADFLIESGMEVNSQDNEGMTALHSICKDNFYYAKDCAECCVRDLRMDSNICDKRGRTALHYAVENDNLHVVRVLAKYQKLDLIVKDESDLTPIQLSKKIDNKKIYNFLCEVEIKQLSQDD